MRNLYAATCTPQLSRQSFHAGAYMPELHTAACTPAYTPQPHTRAKRALPAKINPEAA